jgi:hypothetical protein
VPVAQWSSGELVAESNRKLWPTEVRLAFATEAVERASLQHTSGPHKPKANGSNHSEPAASSEAATKPTPIGYMSGPLCGMPDGITSNAQVATESLPQAEGKTNSIYVSAFTDTRGVDTGPFHSGLSAQVIGFC